MGVSLTERIGFSQLNNIKYWNIEGGRGCSQAKFCNWVGLFIFPWDRLDPCDQYFNHNCRHPTGLFVCLCFFSFDQLCQGSLWFVRWDNALIFRMWDMERHLAQLFLMIIFSSWLPNIRIKTIIGSGDYMVWRWQAWYENSYIWDLWWIARIYLPTLYILSSCLLRISWWMMCWSSILRNACVFCAVIT